MMWPFKRRPPEPPPREIGTVQFVFDNPPGRAWHRAYLDTGELVPHPGGCGWSGHEGYCNPSTQ